jgi:hypothetical protein
VLEREPNHPAALFDRAIVLYEFLGKPADAQPLFQRFVEVAPEGEARKTAERYLQSGQPASNQGASE